jgi:hypothetical protein
MILEKELSKSQEVIQNNSAQEIITMKEMPIYQIRNEFFLSFFYLFLSFILFFEFFNRSLT